MRTLLKIVIVFSILSISALMTTLNNNGVTFALCEGTENPNLTCHQQYNSHSNTETTSTSTTEEESDLMLCTDLKCNLGKEYLLDPRTDIMDDPLDLLDD
ncbi:hypothetical protein [Candidatus Nitrosocosmicus sp. T]